MMLALAFLAATSLATVGKPAPAFSAVDSKGAKHSLADWKGSLVVLEWNNKDCPFVRKHYDSGNMQKLQKEFVAKGVVWVTVSSSADGKQGFVDGKAAEAMLKERGAAPSTYLLDHDGAIGHAYGAKNTPAMFIVGKDGTLVYAGAIDDKASTDPKDVPGAKNYVRAALEELLAGKPVTQAETQPYGCSVKY